MITNRVGPPVRGADFFGREVFVNLASDKLKAGHVLWVGIGRVLNELGEIAAINDFEALKLDPFAPKVAADFLDALAASAKIPLS